ncbi:MAG: hypothetical protein K6G80_08700 [Treponema sp.]|nr:hypothetical protein [Treponema sp.]
MAEKNIVTIDSSNNTLRLDSGLRAAAFGKIRMQKENGMVAVVRADGQVSFEDWSFEGPERLGESEADGIVCYSGHFSGATLLTLLDSGVEAACRASRTVCMALTAAISQAVELTPVGAGGIIVDERDGESRVLFLPAALFEQAAKNHGESAYAVVQGAYLHKGLTSVSALAFTRAAIVYRALSGTDAFSATDSTLRQADMFDCNFVPLELAVQHISRKTALAVNACLSMQADLRILPGEKRSLAKKQAEIQAQRTMALDAFENGDVLEALAGFVQGREAEESPDFAEMRRAWLLRQAGKIKRRRFLRRNRTQLIAGVCAAAAVAWGAASFVQENETLATSIGLTSAQTVETLYTGIHKTDVTVVKEVSSGLTNLMTIVSGVYVTNKQRLAMDQQNGTVSPAEWLFFKNTSNFWIYGLTQFTLDGEAADASFDYPRRLDKNVPLTEEAGRVLKKGDSAEHTVRYNLVHTDSSEQIFIDEVTDVVTLTWKGKRWLVTGIESSSSQKSVRVKQFRQDYAASLETSGGDVAEAVASLRSSYSWLPTDAELLSGARTMVETYNNSAAAAFMTK